MAGSKLKTFVILAGDALILYASLVLALFIRRGFDESLDFADYVGLHIPPFSIVFAVWLIVFYLSNLYDPRYFKNKLEFFRNFISALAVSGALAILFFYLFPYFGEITPKTNLVLTIVVFGILGSLWRYVLNRISKAAKSGERVLLIAGKHNGEKDELVNYLNSNPQLGYQIKYRIEEESNGGEIENLAQLITEHKIDIVVIPAHLKEKKRLASLIYNNLSSGIRVTSFSEFYEMIFRKVPLAELEEAWFLENLVRGHKIYEGAKRPFEFVLALLLTIILSPLLILILILVKLTSKGPAIFRQMRIGKNGKEFILYKFRSMFENNDHRWPDKDDRRITPIGGILRKTHLDELPQLFNILKGDISFVGPRPDFIDFYKNLNGQIPYYSIRTLVKPGVSGWAQINFPVTASLDETRKRLSYDLYYIKNYSPLMDLIIILKTIKVMLTAKGR